MPPLSNLPHCACAHFLSAPLCLPSPLLTFLLLVPSLLDSVTTTFYLLPSISVLRISLHSDPRPNPPPSSSDYRLSWVLLSLLCCPSCSLHPKAFSSNQCYYLLSSFFFFLSRETPSWALLCSATSSHVVLALVLQTVSTCQHRSDSGEKKNMERTVETEKFDSEGNESWGSQGEMKESESELLKQNIVLNFHVSSLYS